ncbi:hypothetical protein [Paenibacillus sp. Soil522]|uniref:hypothetical protein n=1 Tax=Paenibacillus sp. Soil522 TaxID=1736388 RepID=UPI000AFDCE0A|nr:hypothetical protein [Paenibacillus sp. Soil522]
MHKVVLVPNKDLQELLVKVDWKRHGFEVIGQARNGRDALRLPAGRQHKRIA